MALAQTPTRVARPAPAARAAEALGRGALLLVAGAGFGKTTLLEEVLRDGGLRAAWVRTTAGERDPGRLLVALLDAVELALPGVGGSLLERLAGGAEPLAVAARLPEELDAVLVEPVVVVVDDAERLAGAPDALAVLEALLRARPGRLRVAVATRRPLELRLAKVRLAGGLTELGERDLAFTAGECEQALRLSLGRDPEPAEVELAMRATLGWPLGVVLGTHAGEDPEAALGAYLDEEVLAAAGPELRDALLDASAVDALTPELLEALGAGPGFLEAVAGLGLSLVPVADRPGARAFHPLVRELLRERWRRDRPEAERRALRGRIAEALAADGRTVEAIDAWLDGERWDDALRAITATAPLLVGATPATVRSWLARLPAGARRSPLARLLGAQLVMGEGRPAQAADELLEVLPELGDEDLGTQWSARLVLAECLYFSGRLDAIPELASGFDRPEVRALGRVGDAVALWAGMAHASTGQVLGAERLARLLVQAGGEDDGVLRTWREAFVRGPSGEVDDVLRRIAQELDVAGRDPHLRRPELLLPTSIWLLTARGRFEEALALNEEHMRRVWELDVRADLAALTHVLHAWLLAHCGRTAEAGAALEAAGPAPAAAWPAAVFEGTAALLHRAEGRRAPAAEAARRGLAHLEVAPPLLADIIAFTLVPLLAEADPDAALAVVRRRLAVLAVTHPGRHGRFHRARLLAHEAAIGFAAGRDEAWRAGLGAALDEAADMAGHLLHADWDRLREPVLAALAAGEAPERLLAALEGARPAELLPLTDHPAPAVRAHAIAALARSGHTDTAARLTALADDPDAEVAAAARAALDGLRRSPPPRAFALLGAFGVRVGDWAVEDRAWGRPMAQRLVRLLLARRDEVVLEDDLFEAFWPGKPPGAARSSLQVAVSRARAVLDPPGAAASAIRATGGGYLLVLAPHDHVDADAFERAAEVALATTGGARLAALEAADRLWTGEPLPEDRYADWARPFRERLERRRREVLAALLDARLQAGALTGAAEAALHAIDLDPLDEAAHRALMVVYARSGRRGRALRQFLECRRALVDALGLEPGEATVELQRRVLAGAPV